MDARCLIVDDSRTFLDSACALLEREGMVVVGVAMTGAEALVQLEALRPDVVLVDVFLGDESGLDVARCLTTADHHQDLAVILISTRAEADLGELVAESPARGFVPKSELSAAAIRRFLDPDR